MYFLELWCICINKFGFVTFYSTLSYVQKSRKWKTMLPASWSQWWLLQEAKLLCTKKVMHLHTQTAQTSHYAGGFCGTDARWSSCRWLEFNFSLPFLWHYQGCGCGYEKCVCVHNTLYQRGGVCYFWEPCLLLTFKPTGNGKWFAILETHAEVRQFEDAAFWWQRVSIWVLLKQLLG